MKKFLEKIKEDEQTHSPVVMAFGRMNPPTIGHEKLVQRVKDIAKDYNAPHHVVISHTVDAKKNPLEVAKKLKHAKRFFPNTNLSASSKEKPTFLQHAAALHAAGHDHLVMVAGSDRIPEYETKLNQYNGEGTGKLFNFKKIEVKSAGHRDPDSEGAEGMSASKMREHAQNNRFNDYIDKDGKKKPGFKSGVPSHVPENHVRELFRDVRKGLGLNEDFNRGLFKAIFVTGGPGSGKDIIIREAIAESKTVELNSVQAFDLLMDKQPSPIDLLHGIYRNKINNNPKSLASSMYQQVIDVCIHLKQLEDEWTKYHYSKGYVDGIEDFKAELNKTNEDDAA